MQTNAVSFAEFLKIQRIFLLHFSGNPASDEMFGLLYVSICYSLFLRDFASKRETFLSVNAPTGKCGTSSGYCDSWYRW